MRGLRILVSAVAIATIVNGAEAASVEAGGGNLSLVESYVDEPMPPGFQVVIAELEGPVFADAAGKTIYHWPFTPLRNGNAGEQKGVPSCTDVPYRVNAGLMSPYPGGLELPEVDTRPSCTDVWRPVLAGPDARNVGNWTIVLRPDGAKQWAYAEQPLYTSVLDKERGHALGGSRIFRSSQGAGALRHPVGPPPNIPTQFSIQQLRTGRLLTTTDERSVYQSDSDSDYKSNCNAACQREWAPILAPDRVRPQADWSTIEIAPGVKQWTYRKRPVYTRLSDEKPVHLIWNDVPGWRNVYTQPAPPPPKEFTVQLTIGGEVLADAQGRTIYYYNCTDDAVDQLDCSHPDTPQAYRFSLCGKGDPDRCQRNFPYLVAAENAKSDSQLWSITYVDPQTGRRAEADQEGALRVWAYRDRPLYVCGFDKEPGDIECDNWGDFQGIRTGFNAFWLRDEYGHN